MRRSLARLERIEARARVRDAADRESSLRFRRQIAEAKLALIPGYALITREDADPETWRDVRRTRAVAAGDWDAAGRLADPGALPGTHPRRRERAERLHVLLLRSIARARRRLARETGRPIREIIPNWLEVPRSERRAVRAARTKP